VDEVALEAEEMNHHPDIDIRWRTVHFALSTHSEGGLTQLDVELAHRISQAASRLGATRG
jgi:4a-hydroxytetrahydrobiopterin dehydratase